jgi:phosphonopyruvate decarboxylase
MIAPELFYNAFRQASVEFMTGVPDSLLKNFCAFVADHTSDREHVIAANEGGAVALAVGYHLASGKVPLVYLQNSGLGNLVNPLVSLVDADVYGIPLLLLIGWRGEPGVADEPQHVKQGKITLAQLDCMGIPYCVVDGTESDVDALVANAVDTARSIGGAYAIVVRKGSFSSYHPAIAPLENFDLTREAVIQKISQTLDKDDVLVATTGMASRELFEYRTSCGRRHDQDFLVVGGMGHASQIALGIALQQPERRVICIDGDGAALMHMGSMAINGQSCAANFSHIIINNGAHDSVGGQPTVGLAISLPTIARECGYKYSNSCSSSVDLVACLARLLQNEGPALLEVKVGLGSRSDLGRPTLTPWDNKQSFMKFLQV